jgi:hypothetical protein
MARPRLPVEVASITGSAQRSPGRFKGRSAPVVACLGDAPKRFTQEQVTIWKEFAADLPWLRQSDRRVVALAVMLQHTVDTNPACPIGVYAQLRMALSALGATPVDRTRVQVADDPADDPANEFLN